MDQLKDNIPKHIAIIMDGNGRWARQRGLPRTEGHRRGIKIVRDIVKAASELGLEVLTLFAFSTENWDRPKKEINMLMRSLDNYLKSNISELNKNNIRFSCIGDLKRLPQNLQKRIQKTKELTKDNSGLIVNLALNYGGRAEIVNAAKNIAEAALEKRITPASIDENLFCKFLYTADLPDPDLLIRTSGEQRISNFFLWQISYCELLFVDKFWPDFSQKDLEEAIIEYQNRNRRFGRI